MYTDINFKTKKALKDALVAGKEITVYQPNGDLFGRPQQRDGIIQLEGPHYPQPHKWYTRALIADGKVVKLLPA
jgi:hypothetical protein